MPVWRGGSREGGWRKVAVVGVMGRGITRAVNAVRTVEERISKTIERGMLRESEMREGLERGSTVEVFKEVVSDAEVGLGYRTGSLELADLATRMA